MRRGRDACISRRLIRPHFPPAYCFGILLPDFTPVVSAGGFRFGDSRPEGCSIGAVKVKENRLRERSEGGFRFREGQPAEKC